MRDFQAKPGSLMALTHIAAVALFCDLHAEARWSPRGSAARLMRSLPCPKSFRTSGHSVLCCCGTGRCHISAGAIPRVSSASSTGGQSNMSTYSLADKMTSARESYLRGGVGGGGSLPVRGAPQTEGPRPPGAEGLVLARARSHTHPPPADATPPLRRTRPYLRAPGPRLLPRPPLPALRRLLRPP